MGGVNTSLLALAAAVAAAGVGFAALYTARGGVSIITSRGNPRDKAQAIAALESVGWGLLVVLGAVAIATFLSQTLKFG